MRTGTTTTATAPPPRTSRTRAPSRASSASRCIASTFAADTASGCSRHFLAELPRGSHAESRRALQSRDQVRRLPRARARDSARERFATGHYARLDQDADGPALLKGVDAGKDQSYFLHAVPRAAVRQRRCCRSANCHKAEVRELARDGRSAGASTSPTAPASASSASGRSASSCAQYLPDEPGPIVDADGDCSANTSGLHLLHAGPARRHRHRRHARRARPAPGTSPPRALADNALIVVQGHDHPAARSAGSCAPGPCNWLVPPAAGEFRRQREAALPAGRPGRHASTCCADGAVSA